MVNQLIGFGVGGDGDPFFASVVLLMHCEGTDASTAFLDNSPISRTLTAVGNAQVDTAQFKFGVASALFDGTGDYITAPDSADWDFGTSDYTLEFFVRFNATTANTVFMTNSDSSGDNGFVLWLSAVSGLTLYSQGSSYTFAWTPSTNTWYHIAVSRNGTNLRAFLDGTQIGTTQTSSNNIVGGTRTLSVGGNGLVAGHVALNGWLDEVRVTKGVARYTGTFTPPIAPFPNS